MNPFKHETRRRRGSGRPRVMAIATAAAAAAVTSVVAISTPFPTGVEGAFSTPAFTTPTRPIPLSARPSVASTTASSIQGSASSVEDVLPRRRPLHQPCRHSPSATLSREELLEGAALRMKQPAFSSLQQGAALRRRNVRIIGSLSGQYGGLGRITSLSVSRSSNALGFQVEDFQSYKPNNNVDDENNDNELQFRIEDFGSFREDNQYINQKEGAAGRVPVVQALDPLTASPTSRRVAHSLLENGGTTRSGRTPAADDRSSNDVPNGGGRSARPPEKSKSNSIVGVEDAPPSLPWVPTESQINSRKVVVLRAACAERELLTTGKKAELRDRLLIWAAVQDRKRVKDRLSGLKDLIEKSKSKETTEAQAASMADAAESYDVNALTNKRKALTKVKKRSRGSENNRGILGLVDESYFNATATDTEIDDEEEDIMDSMDSGENSMVTSASMTRLSQTFDAPSSNFTNREVSEMYNKARAADQSGDREGSKAILTRLRDATPYDMRVVRRLSRMEQEDGNLSAARRILQRGLRLEPNNAHLLHGVGQLERKAGNDHTAKKYFRRALKEDPKFANPYHALGTLEHTHGNIRAALTVIKDGIKSCPQNHRLYHALGDVYLDANMLDLAEESYLSGLQHCPHWSKSFFYSSLSFVSYALGHTQDCRTLLRQSLEINEGMHAQGVIALAQLEESEGYIAEARKVYRDAISGYEKKRRGRSPFRGRRSKPQKGNANGNSSPSYSGDKWINVFRSWARMEEVHGTYETANIVYSKAARLFPNNIGLTIQWAELQADRGGDEHKVRLLYEATCRRVGGRNADPYQKLATFEMKRKNFAEAQEVLWRGAQAVAEVESAPLSEGGGGSRTGKSGLALAPLLHTWGVCEYHLGSYSRAEQLFDKALRAMGLEDGDSAMRSLILYSMARLEFSRGEYILAQHCIGLSLKENLLPGGNSLMWKLWSQIADKMENEHLATRCKEQALLRWDEERGGTVSDLSRLLGERRRDYKSPKSDLSSNDDDGSQRALPERTGSAMKDMFRKTPWYRKVCPPSGSMDKNWYSGAKLWEL